MVFFQNINPGARVQVKWRGEIETGTIRYAGSLVAKDGDWVGVELDNGGKRHCKYEAQGLRCTLSCVEGRVFSLHDKKSEVEQTKVSPVYCLNLKSKKESTLIKELIPVLQFILRKKKKTWKLCPSLVSGRLKMRGNRHITRGNYYGFSSFEIQIF